MPSRWDAATHGWSRRVFHYPLPTLMSKNFRLPCTIELQPLSLTPIKMRKVELPRQSRYPSSHSLTTRRRGPKRWVLGSSLPSRHLVASKRSVRWYTKVDGRISRVCSRLRSTPSPTMPSLRVTDGPTKSGVSRILESSVKLAIRSSLGGSCLHPETRGNRISRWSLSGRTAATCTVWRLGPGPTTTGLAVKSKGMPRTSAYSTSKRRGGGRSRVPGSGVRVRRLAKR